MTDVDFDRLNAAERKALELLARGHTVKSIAAATGLTPNAVNERLRSARRKCGVGSSRELARLIDLQKTGTQENRTVQREPPPPGMQEPARPRGAGRAPFEGAAFMGLLVVTAAALAFQLAPAPVGGPPPTPDPLIDGLVGKPNPDLHALHIEAHAGPPDATEEGRLRDVYMAEPQIAKGVSPLRVVCSASICEISGSFLGTHYQPTMDALQNPNLGDALKSLGLSHIASGYGDAVFVSYLTRKP